MGNERRSWKHVKETTEQLTCTHERNPPVPTYQPKTWDLLTHRAWTWKISLQLISTHKVSSFTHVLNLHTRHGVEQVRSRALKSKDFPQGSEPSRTHFRNTTTYLNLNSDHLNHRLPGSEKHQSKQEEKMNPEMEEWDRTYSTPRPSFTRSKTKNWSYSLRASGQRGSTVSQPAERPVNRSPRDGQSAGLASVATRSIKTVIWSSKTRSQKTETRVQRSSLLEYPFTRAPSTASESMKSKRSFPFKRSAKVTRATIGATISTGTIWVFLWSHFFFTWSGTIDVNWTGSKSRLSNMTAPIRSGLRSLDLGSGVNPSVKMTMSAFLSTLKSIGLGGPALINFLHWFKASFKGGSRAKRSEQGKRAYCLSDTTRKTRTLFQSYPRAGWHQTSTFLWASLQDQARESLSKGYYKFLRANLFSDRLWSPSASPPDYRSLPRS